MLSGTYPVAKRSLARPPVLLKKYESKDQHLRQAPRIVQEVSKALVPKSNTMSSSSTAYVWLCAITEIAARRSDYIP